MSSPSFQESPDQLKLENQLCFPLYAASRLIIRRYQPHLDRLRITYPQYLVLMVLWETETVSVNELGKKLILNTNTVTPLLKRMEQQELVVRQRSEKDERRVIVRLTEKGKGLRNRAADIPLKLAAGITKGPLEIGDLERMKSDLEVLIELLKE